MALKDLGGVFFESGGHLQIISGAFSDSKLSTSWRGCGRQLARSFTPSVNLQQFFVFSSQKKLRELMSADAFCNQRRFIQMTWSCKGGDVQIVSTDIFPHLSSQKVQERQRLTWILVNVYYHPNSDSASHVCWPASHVSDGATAVGRWCHQSHQLWFVSQSCPWESFLQIFECRGVLNFTNDLLCGCLVSHLIKCTFVINSSTLPRHRGECFWRPWS